MIVRLKIAEAASSPSGPVAKAIFGFFLLGLLFFPQAAANAQKGQVVLSPQDELAYRAAFGAAKARNWAAIDQLTSQTSEKLPSKILRWLSHLRATDPDFAEITTFANQNPGWPLIGTLRQRAENASDSLPDTLVEPYFRSHRPQTMKGKLRLASLLIASGNGEAANSLLREFWIGSDFMPEDEGIVLDRFGGRVRPEDHTARLDRLLWTGQSAPARRQLARVPDDARRVGEARLALQGQQEGAEVLVSGLPSDLRGHPGLLFDRVRWFRRGNRFSEAISALRAPPQPLDHPASWWAERDVLAQRLLDNSRPDEAYDLYAWRGLGEAGGELADADFSAGWVALTRLKDPARAFDRFVQLYGEVKTPISLARGAYWAGRAAEAQGHLDDARQWYAKAADQKLTYYGQLAASRGGLRPAPAIGPDPVPSAADIARFNERELVRAARMLAQIGEVDLAKAFLNQLNAVANTVKEFELVAGLAGSIGHKDVALAAARRAGAQGVFLMDAAYPIVPLDLKGPGERALALAMIRQESAFDPAVISRSDARGLMQLLPSTAKDVAKSLSLPFAAERLTQDPAYNVVLGRAYLGQLLESFGGSYVLAVAAYNAGPSRVRQWIAAFGDPRSGAIDPVDWIETMPFKETRNYVQRVMENLQLYRLRLDETDRAFRMADDLRR